MSNYPIGGNGGIMSDLMTSNIEGVRRIKTENGDAAFDAGKVFRAFYEINLENAATRVFKFVSTDDAILQHAFIDLDSGGIRYEVYTGGVEGGTFTPIQEYRTNNMSGLAPVTSSIKLYTGGTLDVAGVNPIDLARVRTGGSNQKQPTVGVREDDIRGYPATIAYVVIKSLEGVNGVSTGVIKWQWENR